MFRLPLLAVAATLVLGGAVSPAAHANPTICVEDVCVCTESWCFESQGPEPVCTKIDLDGNGTYETVCVP